MKITGIITIFAILSLVSYAEQNPAPKFSATASIVIAKRNFESEGDAPSSLNAEMEHIVSRPILDEVARRLNLAEKWTMNGVAPSSDEIYSRVKNMLTVKQVAKVPLIHITAKSNDPAGAVAIANETARAFADDIKEKNDKAEKTAQEAVYRELKAQEELVSQLKLKVQALRKKEGFSETLFTDEQDNNKTIEKMAMEQCKDDRLSAEKEMRAAQERLKKLSELKDKSMEDFAAEANDPFFSSLLEQIRQYEKQLNKITPSLGPDHIEVKKVQAALDELNGKMATAVKGILNGVQAQNIIAKSKMDALDEEISKLSLSLSAPPRVKSPELQQAQAEHEKQNAALEELRKKSITIRHALPDCSVTICEFAEAHPSEFEMAYQAVRQNSIKELHHATSRISVQKQEEPIKGETPGVKPFSPLAIERSIIVSSPVLTNVIQKLNLAQKWAVNGILPSPKEACSLLRGKLTVKQVGDTSVIEISAASPDAAEAVAIANEVARAYKKYAEGIVLAKRQRMEEARERALKEQEAKAQQAELTYKELRKKQGLSEIPFVLEKDTQKQLEEDRIQARLQMLLAKNRVEQWSEMKKDPLLLSLTAYAPDPTVDALRLQIRRESRQLDKMDTASPAAQTVQTTLKELHTRLEKAMEEASKTAEKTYSEQKKKFDVLDQKRASTSSQDENLETGKARGEYEIQKGIFDALKRKVAEMPPPQEKPPRSTVEIISLASSDPST